MDNLSLMDHYLQLDFLAGAERPDARGLHDARLPRRAHLVGRAAAADDGRDLPPPRAAGQDRVDPRRALRRAGRPRHRRGLVRARAPRPRRPLPAAGRAVRAAGGDPARSSVRCGATTTARYVGKHYQLAETINSPQPLRTPHPPIMVGGGGEQKTLRLVARYADACNVFAGRGAGPERSRTSSPCCASGASGRAGPTTRSARPSCTTAPSDMTATGGAAFVEEMRALADVGVDEVHVMPLEGDPVAFVRVARRARRTPPLPALTPRRSRGRPGYAGPHQVVRASVSPVRVSSPTQATWPSGRTRTARGRGRSR